MRYFLDRIHYENSFSHMSMSGIIFQTSKKIFSGKSLFVHRSVRHFDSQIKVNETENFTKQSYRYTSRVKRICSESHCCKQSDVQGKADPHSAFGILSQFQISSCSFILLLSQTTVTALRGSRSTYTQF